VTDRIESLFQQPATLADTDQIAALILRDIVRAQRRRRLLLLGAATLGTAASLAIVLLSGVAPALFIAIRRMEALL
jgi:hypothetical protein